MLKFLINCLLILGTGKTLIFNALRCSLNGVVNFFSISPGTVCKEYYGQSVQTVRNLFKGIKENLPAVLFVDEIGNYILGHLLFNPCGLRGDHPRVVSVIFV